MSDDPRVEAVEGVPVSKDVALSIIFKQQSIILEALGDGDEAS